LRTSLQERARKTYQLGYDAAKEQAAKMAKIPGLAAAIRAMEPEVKA
jgi:hypothetical protein